MIAIRFVTAVHTFDCPDMRPLYNVDVVATLGPMRSHQVQAGRGVKQNPDKTGQHPMREKNRVVRTGAAVEASSPGRPRKPGMRWGGVARSPKSGIERNSSQPQSTEQPSILPATVMHTTPAAVAAVVLVFAGQSAWLGCVVEGGDER